MLNERRGAGRTCQRAPARALLVSPAAPGPSALSSPRVPAPPNQATVTPSQFCCARPPAPPAALTPAAALALSNHPTRTKAALAFNNHPTRTEQTGGRYRPQRPGVAAHYPHTKRGPRVRPAPPRTLPGCTPCSAACRSTSFSPTGLLDLTCPSLSTYTRSFFSRLSPAHQSTGMQRAMAVLAGKQASSFSKSLFLPREHLGRRSYVRECPCSACPCTQAGGS